MRIVHDKQLSPTEASFGNSGKEGSNKQQASRRAQGGPSFSISGLKLRMESKFGWWVPSSPHCFGVQTPRRLPSVATEFTVQKGPLLVLWRLEQGPKTAQDDPKRYQTPLRCVPSRPNALSVTNDVQMGRFGPFQVQRAYWSYSGRHSVQQGMS